MGFRLGLRQRSHADRPHLLVARYRSQADYERDARRMLADGWKMSGWQRLEPDAAPDVIIATWVRGEEE
ncbi:MAG TPA: hypothetical protein VF112_07085 [Candidatus Dormibacteraeota bacterium]